MDRVMFSIGSFEIMWYSALILIGVLIAIFLINKEGKRFKYNLDSLFNMSFYAIIFGLLGARLYFVIFNFDIYKGDFIAIFKIWEGGLAIHGGIIAGLITIYLFTKKNKLIMLKLTDMVIPGLFFAQAIGRWGNFFNSEAHGPVTTFENLQNLNIPQFIIDGMNINGIYYHPTFFYEFIICIIGFIIVLIVRRFKYIKIGTLTSFYLMWYGLFRFLIESMRTDSLMFFGFKSAQIVSILMFVVGLLIFIYNFRKSKFEYLYNSENN